MALETELATYDARIDEIRQHPGEYVLIAGTKIVAYYATWDEALDVGYARYEPGHFMIRQESGPDAAWDFGRYMPVLVNDAKTV